MGLLWVVPVGCSGDGLPEVVARGDRVDVAPLGGGPVCAGSVRWFDHGLREVEARLELPEEDRVTFYWGPDAPTEYCPSGSFASGCAPSGERVAFGNLDSFNHEMVHIAVDQVGETTALIEEGLAVYASGQCWDVDSPRVLATYVRPEEEADRLSVPAIGGSFVAFLVETHGMSKLHELRAAVPRDADLSVFETAIRDVYGEPLEAVEERWHAGRVTHRCGPAFPRWPEASVEYQYAPTSLASTVDCGAATTYGPIDPSVVYGNGFALEPLIPGMYTHHSLVVPQAARIVAALDGPPGTKAHLVRASCWDLVAFDESLDPDLPDLAVITVHAGESMDLTLPGCIWDVFLVSDGDTPVDVTLNLRPSE
jgi:hypothetical protein